MSKMVKPFEIQRQWQRRKKTINSIIKKIVNSTFGSSKLIPNIVIEQISSYYYNCYSFLNQINKRHNTFYKILYFNRFIFDQDGKGPTVQVKHERSLQNLQDSFLFNLHEYDHMESRIVKSFTIYAKQPISVYQRLVDYFSKVKIDYYQEFIKQKYRQKDQFHFAFYKMHGNWYNYSTFCTGTQIKQNYYFFIVQNRYRNFSETVLVIVKDYEQLAKKPQQIPKIYFSLRNYLRRYQQSNQKGISHYYQRIKNFNHMIDQDTLFEYTGRTLFTVFDNQIKYIRN